MSNKDKLIASAQKNLEKGQTQKAIKDYHDLVSLEPKNEQYRQKLAELLSRANMPAEAIGHFEIVAKSLSEKGFYLKAIALYKQIQKLDPNKVDAYWKLAELSKKQGMAGNAMAEYRSLLEFFEKKKMKSEAGSVLQKMVELEPENYTLHSRVLQFLLQEKLYDKVRESLVFAVESLDKSGAAENKQKLLDAFIPRLPADKDFLLDLTRQFSDKHAFAEAARIYGVLLKSTPDDPALLEKLADCYQKAGDPASERLTLAHLIKIEPTSVRCERLVRVCLAEGDSLRALNELESCKNVLAQAGRKAVLIELYRELDSLLPSHAKIQTALNFLGAGAGATASVPSGQPAAVAAAVPSVPAAQPVAKAVPQPAPPPLSTPVPTTTAAPSSPVTTPAKTAVVVATSETLTEETSFDSLLGFSLEVVEEPAAPAADDLAQSIESADSADLESAPAANVLDALEEAAELEELELEELELEELELEALPLDEDAAFGPELLLGDAPIAVAVADEAVLDDDLLLSEHVSLESTGVLDLSDDSLSAFLPDTEEAVPELEVLEDLDELVELEDLDEADDFAGLVEGHGVDVSAFADVGLELQSVEVPDLVESEALTFGPSVEEVQPDLDLQVEMAALEDLSLEFDAVAVEDSGSILLDSALPDPVSDAFDSGGLHAEADPAALDFDALAMEEHDAAAPTLDVFAATAAFDEPLPTEEAFSGFEMPEVAAAEVAETPSGNFWKSARSRSAIAEASMGPETPPDFQAELEEIAFYLNQGLLDQAEQVSRGILELDPLHPLATERLNDIARLRQAQSAQAAAVEEDYFDLAAELLDDGAFQATADLESVDDVDRYRFDSVFSEFKKGIEAQIDSEDAEAHYNLGIAYKEMGLIDDAIDEFEKAMRDRDRLVDCLTLIGICHAEKGTFDQAEHILQQAIARPELAEAEKIGMQYELGLLYEAWDRPQEALDCFETVAGVDVFFRNVGEKVDAMRAAGAGSGGAQAELPTAPVAPTRNRVSFV